MNYDTENVITQSKVNETDPDTIDTLDSITTYWDNKAYLVGVQGGFGPVGYYAQYRRAEAKANIQGTNTKEKQNSYTTGLMYNFGVNNAWQAKVAYAKNEGLKVNSTKIKDSDDKVWSAQLMYQIDSNAVVYARYRDVKMGEKSFQYGQTTSRDLRGKSDSFKEASIGIEYWF